MLAKHTPFGPLARHVHSMWYRPAVGVDETSMLLLPSGRHELVISLDLTPQRCWQPGLPTVRSQSPVTLRLLRAGAFGAGTSGRAAAMGVSFTACGLRSFTHTALSDHSAPDVAMADLWGGLDSWVERLVAARTPADKFRVLEGLLWRHLRQPSAHAARIEQAAAWLADPFAARSVSFVAEAVGLSERRFVQVFREDTGMTPKVFARVMRFRAAAHCMRRARPQRLTDVATLFNYFDQAHLVREFRALAGMSPGAYLRLDGGHATCLPLSRDAAVGLFASEASAASVDALAPIASRAEPDYLVAAR